MRPLVCLLLVLAAACSPGDAARPASPEPTLEVSVSQFRFDEGTRNLRAAVTNAGEGTVTVTEATIAWSGFERHAAEVEPEPLAPGDTVGFSLQYGDPRCPAGEDATPAMAAVVDGAERVVPLDKDDAAEIRLLHERECLVHELEAAADIELDLADRTTTSARGEHLDGRIVVRPRGGRAIELVDLAGSVLLRLEAPDGLPIRVSSSAGVTRIPVRISSAGRCDPHALGNSSQTFLFGIHVRLGDRPPQRVVRFPTAAEKRLLTGLLDRSCGVS
ncbi:MAG TPA: hypothetical protein VFR87_06300 [Nocardioidaceae bacterium]|nr:hypothetical protein [Nocardioidaceae bacterium]